MHQAHAQEDMDVNSLIFLIWCVQDFQLILWKTVPPKLRTCPTC